MLTISTAKASRLGQYNTTQNKPKKTSKQTNKNTETQKPTTQRHTRNNGNNKLRLKQKQSLGNKNSVKSSQVVCIDIHENHTDENSANHASSCRMNDSVASRLAKARWSQARAPSERADAQHGKELLSLWGALMLCHQVTRVFRPR